MIIRKEDIISNNLLNNILLWSKYEALKEINSISEICSTSPLLIIIFLSFGIILIITFDPFRSFTTSKKLLESR